MYCDINYKGLSSKKDTKMRITNIFMVIFTAAFIFSAIETVAEDEIYRWVDEDGVVHFENQATAQTDAEQIYIKKKRGRNTQYSSNPEPADTNQPTEPQASYAQQKRDERAKKQKEAAEKEKLIAAQCDQANQIMAQLEPATRVMVEQDDGTVIRMDDNDRLKRLREAREYIAGNCNK